MGKEKKGKPKRVDPRWKPPEEGVFKINVDAGMHLILGRITSGIFYILKGHQNTFSVIHLDH
jgi:hypothetical protein